MAMPVALIFFQWPLIREIFRTRSTYRCGPTLHAYVQLSRSRRCSSQQKTQVLN